MGVAYKHDERGNHSHSPLTTIILMEIIVAKNKLTITEIFLKDLDKKIQKILLLLDEADILSFTLRRHLYELLKDFRELNGKM